MRRNAKEMRRNAKESIRNAKEMTNDKERRGLVQGKKEGTRNGRLNNNINISNDESNKGGASTKMYLFIVHRIWAISVKETVFSSTGKIACRVLL